jgi:peroxiredoxin Q/BCP
VARPWILVAALLGALGGGCAVQRPDGGSGLVAPPQEAPAFSAKDHRGVVRTLAELRGRPVVLFFYPKDGTPGCTKEACGFRDAWAKLEARGAVVLGVSADSVERHAAFVAEHKLPFALLSDDGSVRRAYGVSSTFGLSARVTFVIDRLGRIARVFPDVDPSQHVGEVLAALDGL